jgi:hypothetical protein
MNSLRYLSYPALVTGSLAAGVQPAVAQGVVELTHVHGLSYGADGKRLMVPSHHGLAVYEKGRWRKAPGPAHDYMGFAATARNLYSSGHPAPNSGLVNPFGLIRSRDGGKSWDKLGLEGETDFHLLATGWNSGAIYVWNPEPNSRMRQAGLHFTVNEGVSWKRARGQGLQGEANALAVHPDEASSVAVATSKGIFLSRDSGESFSAIASGVQGLAVFFDLDGRHLWHAGFDGRPLLIRSLLGRAEGAEAALPKLSDDAVAFVAQNPVSRSEYAIATFGRSVYLSKDGARTWSQIAERGKTR